MLGWNRGVVESVQCVECNQFSVGGAAGCGVFYAICQKSEISFLQIGFSLNLSLYLNYLTLSFKIN